MVCLWRSANNFVSSVLLWGPKVVKLVSSAVIPVLLLTLIWSSFTEGSSFSYMVLEGKDPSWQGRMVEAAGLAARGGNWEITPPTTGTDQRGRLEVEPGAQWRTSSRRCHPLGARGSDGSSRGRGCFSFRPHVWTISAALRVEAFVRSLKIRWHDSWKSHIPLFCQNKSLHFILWAWTRQVFVVCFL